MRSTIRAIRASSARGGPALLAALRASWRVGLVLAVIAGIPMVLVAVVGPFDAVTRAVLVVSAVLLPVSVLVHEAAHALAHVALAPDRRTAEVLGVGRWTGGAIVRWSLGPQRDALVAAVGPLAGVATGAPTLVPGSAFVVTFPFSLLFGLHLVSLRPRADDGAELRRLAALERAS